MFPSSKVNNAYDSLNLPRGASIQNVIDRSDQLVSRCEKSGDTNRLELIRESVRIIKSVDSDEKEQRDMHKLKTKSKSERDLDGQLIALTRATGGDSSTSLPEPKRVKPEQKEVIKKENDGSDLILFSKLNKLLVDETKFLRTVNVLSKMVSSKPSFDAEFTSLLIESVDIVISTKPPGNDMHISTLSDENRNVVANLLNVIIESKLVIPKEILNVWKHAVFFRNSFYLLDNFLFAKKCSELIELVKEENHSDRMLSEIYITMSVVALLGKRIPGRLVDAKTTLGAIYKLGTCKEVVAKLLKSFSE